MIAPRCARIHFVRGASHHSPFRPVLGDTARPRTTSTAWLSRTMSSASGSTGGGMHIAVIPLNFHSKPSLSGLHVH